MKTLALGLMLAGSLALPGTARAASNTTVGVGTGAVAGALIAGPVGAVVGGIVGGVVGSNSERARPRRVRRIRAARPRNAALRPVRVAQEQRARDSRAPEPARTGSVAAPTAPAKAPPAPTTWQNPR